MGLKREEKKGLVVMGRGKVSKKVCGGIGGGKVVCWSVI